MEHLTFFKSIKTEIKRCYTFAGAEEFVKERALEELKEAVLKGANEDFNMQILGDDTEISAVYEAVSTLPFMGDMRLVIWNNPKVFNKEIGEHDLKLLKETLSTLHDAVCLLIFIKGAPDKRRKYYKILKENSTVVEFNPLSDFEAARWVGSYFKRNGKEIVLPIAEEIVASVGTSVLDLNNEVGKIYAAMGERITVEKQDLKVLSGSNISFDVFGIINSFLRNNSKKAMNELYSLLNRGDSGFMILGALASKLRGYYQARILLESGMNKASVVEALGGGYGAKRAVEECKSLSAAQIKRGIESLEYADYAIKNGLLNEKAAVEYAVVSTFIA